SLRVRVVQRYVAAQLLGEHRRLEAEVHGVLVELDAVLDALVVSDVELGERGTDALPVLNVHAPDHRARQPSGTTLWGYPAHLGGMSCPVGRGGRTGRPLGGCGRPAALARAGTARFCRLWQM